MNCFKKRSKLPQQDLDYLVEHTRYTEEVIKEWYKSFLKDFPNGRVTKVKFVHAFKMMFPNGNAERFCEQVFDEYDSDGKGGIDFKEFMMAMDGNRTAKDKLKWAFKLYDINGDNHIDREEITKTVEAIYDMLAVKNASCNKGSKSAETEPSDASSAKNRAEAIFNRLDQNCDGLITEEEFLRIVMEDDELRNMLEPDLDQ